MADSRDSTSAHDDESFKAAEDVVARILARQGTALASTRFQDTTHDAGDLEREARAGMRRVNDIALLGVKTIHKQILLSLRQLKHESCLIFQILM